MLGIWKRDWRTEEKKKEVKIKLEITERQRRER
jgi:hypothetical protein